MGSIKKLTKKPYDNKVLPFFKQNGTTEFYEQEKCKELEEVFLEENSWIPNNLMKVFAMNVTQEYTNISLESNNQEMEEDFF